MSPPGCTGSFITPCTTFTQGDWLNDKGVMVISDGVTRAINQSGGGCCRNQVSTSVITLLATAIGISQVTWGGTYLDFFGIYAYNSEGISIPTGHSFTIVPEPTVAALIALGLLGLAARRLRSGP